MCENLRVSLVLADVRERFQATIPPEVRSALGIKVGDSLAFEITESDEVLVRGMRLIPTDQAWFWNPGWQRKERDADQDLADGNFTRYESSAEFLASLQ